MHSDDGEPTPDTLPSPTRFSFRGSARSKALEVQTNRCGQTTLGGTGDIPEETMPTLNFRGGIHDVHPSSILNVNEEMLARIAEAVGAVPHTQEPQIDMPAPFPPLSVFDPGEEDLEREDQEEEDTLENFVRYADSLQTHAPSQIGKRPPLLPVEPGIAVSKTRPQRCADAHCNAVLPFGAKFCPECGRGDTLQGRHCIECGYKFAGREKFCPECGSCR